MSVVVNIPVLALDYEKAIKDAIDLAKTGAPGDAIIKKFALDLATYTTEHIVKAVVVVQGVTAPGQAVQVVPVTGTGATAAPGIASGTATIS